LFFAVPEKVWNLKDDTKISPDVLDLNRKPNEDDMWWNQAGLTHLDLSSNVLTEISGAIQNLMDLTVLNVSRLALD
jgi:Leucine-rich repeat (LRR) protein